MIYYLIHYVLFAGHCQRPLVWQEMIRGWANCSCERSNQQRNHTVECWAIKKLSTLYILIMCVPIRGKNIWKISKYTFNFSSTSNLIPYLPIHWIFLFVKSKKTVELIHSKKSEISSDLIGSWEVQVGDMDQVLHLWRITGGFEKIDTAGRVLENDTVKYKFTRWMEFP